VQWYFVEYTPELFQCYTTQLGWEYEQFANQFTSIAYEQDFFAIYSLKQQGLIPENAVFLPGFCGDFYAGSKTIQANIDSLQKLSKYTIDKNAFEENISSENQKTLTKSLHSNKYLNLNDSYQNWYANHKSDKYINNGLRAFEYFDFTWIFPLMDYEYYNFWKNCIEQQLKNKLFYQEFLVEHYFKVLGIDFDLKTSEEKVYQNPIVQSLKKIVPKKLKKVIQNTLFKKQTFVNNQNILAHIFAKDVPKTPFKITPNENQMHAKWFLRKSEL
jgi:asparagine synthase (glutamine-hydrolysing)